MEEEKREFPRLQLHMLIDVEYEVPKTAIEGITLAKNISEGGIQIPVDAEIEEGTSLELKFLLPHLEKPIFASGEVIWKHEGQEVWEGHCLTGVKFTRISKEDQTLISGFIDTFLPK